MSHPATNTNNFNKDCSNDHDPNTCDGSSASPTNTAATPVVAPSAFAFESSQAVGFPLRSAEKSICIARARRRVTGNGVRETSPVVKLIERFQDYNTGGHRGNDGQRPLAQLLNPPSFSGLQASKVQPEANDVNTANSDLTAWQTKEGAYHARASSDPVVLSGFRPLSPMLISHTGPAAGSDSLGATGRDHYDRKPPGWRMQEGGYNPPRDDGMALKSPLLSERTSVEISDIPSSHAFSHVCSAHPGSKLELWCHSCLEPVCVDCTLPAKQHYDHDWEKLNQVYDEVYEEIEQRSVRVAELVEDAGTQLIDVETRLGYLDECYDNAKAVLEETT
ncbi:hypothetical protein EV182_003724, partial [Spiromyces aspiralis]